MNNNLILLSAATGLFVYILLVSYNKNNIELISVAVGLFVYLLNDLLLQKTEDIKSN